MAALLHDRTVDITLLNLAIRDGQRDALTALLSPDERERAARFRFDLHRNRYVAARAQLRLILSAHTGVAPEAIEFAYGTRGKPSVDGIAFNVSHSGDIGIVAVTSSAPVGVDVELVRAVDDLRGMARISFSSSEREQVLSASDPLAAFFRCWTRKEAYVKATGEGLSAALDAFTVDLGHAPAPIAFDAPNGSWWIHPLALQDGVAGAVAVERDDVEIRMNLLPAWCDAATSFHPQARLGFFPGEAASA